MVVDQAGSLHVRVDDRGSYEFEAAALQVRAERVGLFRGGRQLAEPGPAVDFRLSADESPDVL